MHKKNGRILLVKSLLRYHQAPTTRQEQEAAPKSGAPPS